MSDGARDLLIRGLAAMRAGDHLEARRYLEWLLRLDPDEQQRIEAWLALAEMSTDPVEKRNYLEDVLARDTGEARARRALAILDGKLKVEDIVDPDQVLQPVVEVEQATGHPVLLPQKLPPGYELTGYSVRYCRQGVYLPVLHYSDGLNLLTVFENRPQERGRGRGRGRFARRRHGGRRARCRARGPGCGRGGGCRRGAWRWMR